LRLRHSYEPNNVLCVSATVDRIWPVLCVGRFHGIISRDEADLLLTEDEDEDGRYLIRESQRAKEQYTLAIRSTFSPIPIQFFLAILFLILFTSFAGNK